MKLFLIGLAIIATVCAQSSDYLPPAEEYGASTNVVESNFLESEPSHNLADDGYRYKTVKRFRHRHRRDVSELSNSYLPPHSFAASAPAAVYSAPAPVYSAPAQVYSAPAPAESAPAPVFSAPAPVYSAPAPAAEYYESSASEPAHTLAADGYRYKTVKRYRLRHRRDVSELSNSYLPPHSVAASAPAPVYSAPAPVYSAPAQVYSAPAQAESAPAPVFSAPAQVYSAPAPAAEYYESSASEPAHTLAADGYRYKTVKRYRLRHRRDVSELSNSYLPPHSVAASAPAPVYSAPAPVYSAPAQVYSAPAQAESAPAPVFSAPAQVYSAPAPAAEYYESSASEPAHTLAADGYRYKTVKRYRLRHRRDVSELSNSYLPPHSVAASAPAPVYSAPAPVYSAPAQVYSAPAQAESAPAPVFSAPAQVYSAPAPATEYYESSASEPAHTLAADGYRYKTVKRYRLRHRRDVSELSNSYLPPHSVAASAPAPVYSAPAPVYSAPAQVYSAPAQAESAPAPVFSAPDQVYSAPAPAAEYYESSASEPAHTLAADGYRYKTVKRYRLRHRRDVSELSNSYLPPHSVAASAPAPVYSAPAPVYSAPAPVYSAPAESAPAPVYSAPAPVYSAPAAEYYESSASEPAHTLADDGYRYKTVKRFRYRHRN